MKFWNYMALSTLCMVLTSCSAETSSNAGNIANDHTDTAETQIDSTQSEPTVDVVDTEETTTVKGNISGNRGGMIELPEGFEDMTEEEKANYMAEQGIEIPEATGDMTAMRENMNASDKTAMRENMGMGQMASPESREYPEGFEDMTEEEKANYMAEQGIVPPENMDEMMAMRENMDVSDKMAMRENMGMGQGASSEYETNPQESQDTPQEESTTFKGEVIDIADNEFLLCSEDGTEKTITIPKEMEVANGDYSRILLGMNLSVGFDEENTLTSVTIVQ